jgi:hypothetical protein
VLARFGLVLGGVTLIGATLLVAPVSAQQAIVRPYDGIQAGLDAFRLAEERRQAAASLQVTHNNVVRWWGGYPSALPAASLEYVYAYGNYPPYLPPGAAAPLTVFQPWPYVPGDIYGYTYYIPVRQPVTQAQVQTGPNRWESHPVYNPPLPELRPLPLVDSPLLNGTPYAAPAPPPAQAPSAPAQQPAVQPPTAPLPPVPAPPAPTRAPRER